MNEQLSDVVFEKVSENSLMSYECSPEPADFDFIGLLLNAPKVITFVPGYRNPINGTWARIIVCGYYSFKYSTLGLNGNFVRSITLVAEDEKTKISYRGKMRGIDHEISRPSNINSGSKSEEFSEDIRGGYFNPNLASIMGLPEQEADYIVYAQLGSYESNRVRISVRKSNK